MLLISYSTNNEISKIITILVNTSFILPAVCLFIINKNARFEF